MVSHNLRSPVLMMPLFSIYLSLILQAPQYGTAAVVVSIDGSIGRLPISPNIYGVAYASTEQLKDLNIPLNRQGGNPTSRYNWLVNADNRGSDWFYESIGYDSAEQGEHGDSFIATSKAAGAQAMITLPLLPFIARLGPDRSKLSSFSILKYGKQSATDTWFPDAGNGVLQSNGKMISGNNPLDANIPSNSSLQQSWVRHIVQKWGSASNGGLKYYLMDNEPSIWFSTHRDVQTIGPTMEEIKTRILDYGSKVKAVDPGALVVGPEEWGWSGFLFSGFDQQYGALHGWSGTYPDRDAHGGRDYLPWLLSELKKADTAGSGRILDVFSVHYYPQGGEFDGGLDSRTKLLRNRSTRELWDPKYTSESWISDKVALIPRLKSWIAQYYPGTKIAITEYNWGADGDMNGATVQADVLGIFGQQGLDMAARWVCPETSTPTYKAFKMYRNYDGNRSTFGDLGISAFAPNPDELSAFAAIRSSDNALTVMIINKVLSGDTSLTLQLSNINIIGQDCQVWRLAHNLISRVSDCYVSDGKSMTASVPQQSITLFVLSSQGIKPGPQPSPKGSPPQTNPSPNLSPPVSPKGSPTFSTKAFLLTPSTVELGSPVTVRVLLSLTGGDFVGGIVDLEIFNNANIKVFQEPKTNQSFLFLGDSRNYTWTWTPTSVGTYRMKLGTFNGEWTVNFSWEDSLVAFTAVSRSSPSFSPSPSPKPPPSPKPSPNPSPQLPLAFSSKADVLPTKVTVGHTATINASVQLTQGICNNCILDVEVYDVRGHKVFQMFEQPQNFKLKVSVKVSYDLNLSLVGQYVVKIGIFSSDWLFNPYWNDRVRVFIVDPATS